MLGSKQNKLFREVYSAYYAGIFSVIYSRVKVREDAEDICHELFITMYNKLDEIIEPKKWLLGSARYVILNYYRKKKMSVDNIDIEDLENILPARTAASETEIILREALENNDNYHNEKERALFELVAINRFSYDQAGKQLGLTKRQVQYTYEKVSARIMDYLKKHGISQIGDIL